MIGGMAAAQAPARPFFYFRRGWYKGTKPTFYDTKSLPGIHLLRENYEAIRREVLGYYQVNAGDIKPNYTPYAYREAGWRTLNLYSYFLRYRQNCEKFPLLDSIVRRIPGMTMTQIAVLDPHTRIKAHFGDTDAIIRTHLGLSVPGSLPEIGFRLRREDIGWAEGDMFSFCIAHRHYAWNHTDTPRVVLIVDTMRPDYMDERYAIAGKALAAIAMKEVATRLPALKKTPVPILRGIHPILGAAFRGVLAAQRRLSLPVDDFVRMKID